jgi:hypothetical protein
MVSGGANVPPDRVIADASGTAYTDNLDGLTVLDPQLDVWDGVLKKGLDKDIDVELKMVEGTCKATVGEDPAEVFTKHKVRWMIENNTTVDQMVEVAFNHPEGSPLKPCTTKTPVSGNGGTAEIKCVIRDDADSKTYTYDIRCWHSQLAEGLDERSKRR